MSSLTNSYSPASISVLEAEAEAQAEKRQVTSDDVEISSEERSWSHASSNATGRSRWREYKLMVSLGIVFMVTSVLVLILVWVDTSGSSNASDMPPVLYPGLPTIDETPRFRSPDFVEKLIRTIVGVDHLPGTPQLGALEWMASDDLEMWDYETISVERLKQRCALVVFHIAT
jgi:hypothetical protein